ncbi:MAG TPA: protein kinase [Gammaproteobacteria bacterium]|nr:protein kinase [Gammaproteobacteria bacterium]
MRTQALATEFDFTAVDWPNGENLGNWRAVDLLGSGGTAEVWRAVAPDGRDAALKIVKRALRRHPGANALLRREHEILRLVASRHLVEPYELVDCDGAAVLVLEYLPHGDLVPLLGAPPRHWLPALSAVIAALAALERHRLAHGDLKARNVLFAADGGARLADLTSARPLDGPAAAATAAYGLPEPRVASAREADCFALAALLFELATGQLPYGLAGASAGTGLADVAVAKAAAAELKAAAMVVLEAQGRGQGLSYFVDVIESVRGKQD